MAGTCQQIGRPALPGVLALEPSTSEAGIDCHGVTASDAEWRMVRAAAADVAREAAAHGSAGERFGRWQLQAQRLAPPSAASAGSATPVALRLIEDTHVVGSGIAKVPPPTTEDH